MSEAIRARLLQALNEWDDMKEGGPVGDIFNDIRIHAAKLGWRKNTCGSPVEWGRKHLAKAKVTK